MLLDPPLGGPRNMARDHALALGLAPGSAVLRLYSWDSPTISFGRNEPVRALRERVKALGDFAFVRRPTGGRAVLHDCELTYAVVVPLRALGGARHAYAVVNRGLVTAMRALGVRAELAPPPGEALRPDAGPCFRAAAAGEVMVGGGKLVGSAQARIGGALLQHGSLLLEQGQGPLEQIWPTDRWQHSGPTSLTELLGATPPWERLVGAMVNGMANELPGSWRAPHQEPNLPDARLEGELLRQYRSSSWTWRV